MRGLSFRLACAFAMFPLATVQASPPSGSSLADQDIAPPTALLFQSAQFRLLTGSALESAIVGYSLQAVPCGDSSQCVEAFYEHGQYAQSEDRGVIRGWYVLRQDRYCAGWDDYQFCAAVYGANDGRLATTDLKCGIRCLKLVERRDAPKNNDFLPLD